MRFILIVILLIIAAKNGNTQMLNNSLSLFNNLESELDDSSNIKMGLYTYSQREQSIKKTIYFNDLKFALRYKPSGNSFFRDHFELGFLLRSYFSNYSNLKKEIYQKPFTVVYDRNEKYSSYLLSPNILLITKYQLIPNKVELSINYAFRYNFGGADFKVDNINKIGHDVSVKLKFDEISLLGQWKANDFDNAILGYKNNQNIKFSIPDYFYSRLKLGLDYLAFSNGSSYIRPYAYYMGTIQIGSVRFKEREESYKTLVIGTVFNLRTNSLDVEYLVEPTRINRYNAYSAVKKRGLTLLYSKEYIEKIFCVGVSGFREQELSIDQYSLTNDVSNYFWYIHIAFIFSGK